MKLGFRDIEGFVKKPSPAVIAILVYGPDEGLIRERAATMGKSVVADLNDPFNVTELRGDVLLDDPARLMDEAQSQSLMGGRRLIRIREATDKIAPAFKVFLKNPPKGANLILVEAGELGPRSTLRGVFESAENAVAVPCYVDDERSLARVITDDLKATGFSIGSEALALLTENLLGDRALARGELEKLKLYMASADTKAIALADVLACMSGSGAQSFEDVSRAAASGQIDDADRALCVLLAEGVPPVTILRAVMGYFYRLHLTKCRMDAGESIDSATAKLQPPLFFKLKPVFESQLRSWQRTDLFTAMHVLREAETQCKQTGAPDQLLCGRALLAICQMARKSGMNRRTA